MTFEPLAEDAVRALPNRVLIEPGSVGRVLFWSQTGHPIVWFPSLGRRLIPARHLEPFAGPAPEVLAKERRAGRVALADAMPPRPATAREEPPTVDWCEVQEPVRAAPSTPAPVPVSTAAATRRPDKHAAGRPLTPLQVARLEARLAEQRPKPTREMIRAGRGGG